MNASQLPEKLRELADRIEAAGLPPERDVDPKLSFHGVTDRDSLRLIVRLMTNPLVKVSGDCAWVNGTCCGADVTAFYTPGLLGGEIIQVCKDDQAGVEALLAETIPDDLERDATPEEIALAEGTRATA